MKSVCCIMLANGRPEMVRRAVASFHAQEYERKRLLIWNSGQQDEFRLLQCPTVDSVYDAKGGAIGTLRNRAIDCARDMYGEKRCPIVAGAGDRAEIIAHWDSDDWSHPKRLADQIEMLENTSADIVGYRECLFWDSRVAGESWVYRAAHPHHAIGASMLYPRATWERVPFKDVHEGEDTLWLMHGRFRVHAVPSTWGWTGLPNHQPRMICEVHGANTSSAIVPGVPEWKREPLFDAYCRERMNA